MTQEVARLCTRRLERLDEATIIRELHEPSLEQRKRSGSAFPNDDHLRWRQHTKSACGQEQLSDLAARDVRTFPSLRRTRLAGLLSSGRMDAGFATKFAEEWEAAWNAHDVDRLLGHYTDDVVFQSPYIVHRLQEPTGEVRGKEALRAYWISGLEQQPDLRFSVDDVRLSVDTLVINYTNHQGHRVAEVLKFSGRLVSWGCGAYQPGESLAGTRSLDQ